MVTSWKSRQLTPYIYVYKFLLIKCLNWLSTICRDLSLTLLQICTFFSLKLQLELKLKNEEFYRRTVPLNLER